MEFRINLALSSSLQMRRRFVTNYLYDLFSPFDLREPSFKRIESENGTWILRFRHVLAHNQHMRFLGRVSFRRCASSFRDRILHPRINNFIDIFTPLIGRCTNVPSFLSPDRLDYIFEGSKVD